MLCDHLGNQIATLSSSGVANILVFRSKASKTLWVENEEEDDTEHVLALACKHIINALESLPLRTSSFNLHEDKKLCIKDGSSFLWDLLTEMPPKLDRTLPALMIGSIVTSVFKEYSASLRVTLTVKMGEVGKWVTEKNVMTYLQSEG